MKRTVILVSVCLLTLLLCIGASAYEWHQAQAPSGDSGKLAVAPNGALWSANGTSISRWTGSGWESESAPAGTIDYSISTDLTFSSDGTAHLVRYNQYTKYGNNPVLVYSRRDSSGWRDYNVIDVPAGMTQTSNIAVGPDGTSYIAAVQGIPNQSETLYLYKIAPNGTLTSELVDDNYRAAHWPDLQVSSNGTISIVYTSSSTDDARLATKTVGGSWNLQTLDSRGVTGWRSQVALNSDGLRRIVFTDGYEGKHCAKIETAPGNFSTYALGSTGTSGGVSVAHSVVVGPDGSTYVSYININGTVEVARIKSGVTTEIIPVGDATTIGGGTGSISSAMIGNELYLSFVNTSLNAPVLMWTSVPEPSSVAGLLMGIVGFGGFLLRRKR